MHISPLHKKLYIPNEPYLDHICRRTILFENPSCQIIICILPTAAGSTVRQSDAKIDAVDETQSSLLLVGKDMTWSLKDTGIFSRYV